jgi:AP-1-like factor
LETKVEDLQKASESANHENSILRAQVEKMSMELREYRKRLSLTNGNLNRNSSLGNGVPNYLSGKGLVNSGANNPNDVNFQFEFPKFGVLPGQSKQSTPATTQKAASPVEKPQQSPLDRKTSYQSTNSSSTGLNQTPLDTRDMSSFSALFSPTLLDSVNKSANSNIDFFTNTSRSSTASNGQMSNGQSTSHSSPSASSNSNRGASSSCGTSPEPSMQSPAPGKPADITLSTIGEERTTSSGEGERTFCEKLNMACGNSNNPVPRTMSESTAGTFQEPGFDINGIDWFAQQNGNQFDPQLFGDYREPQENILAGDTYNTDGFFNDAFAMPEFNSPFNAATSPALSRKDKLIEEDEVVPAEDPSQLLTCNTIWYVSTAVSCPPLSRLSANVLVIRDRLQSCPKVKEGEFDLDLLCKDLQKKAKCSETGAVVNESDFNMIMSSYVGQDVSAHNKA